MEEEHDSAKVKSRLANKYFMHFEDCYTCFMVYNMYKANLSNQSFTGIKLWCGHLGQTKSFDEQKQEHFAYTKQVTY